jgi:hypothetical protein
MQLAPGIIYRGLGFKEKRFLPLKRLHNKYKGERCFIIATGPSLRKEDLLTLRNEYTFGMNSICKLFKETDWRPTFFGIQDLYVYDKLDEEMKDIGDSVVLIGDNIVKKRKVPQSWIPFPLNTAYNDYQQFVKQSFFAKFSDDCYRVVYNGFSITFSLIQLAYYLGFEEVYLLGADCSFSKNGKNHFMEHGHYDPRLDTAQERNLTMYRCAKEFCANHNFKIFNATRGGELELFPRISFDSINKK